MRFVAIPLLLTLAIGCAHTRVHEADLDDVLRAALAELGGGARLDVLAIPRLPADASNAVARNRRTSAPNATGQPEKSLVVEELTADHERARFTGTLGTRLHASSSDCGTTYVLLLEKRGSVWKVVSNRVVGDCEAST